MSMVGWKFLIVLDSPRSLLFRSPAKRRCKFAAVFGRQF